MGLTSKYRTFIWDFDGTLFDTYPHTVRAYAETLADLGKQGDVGEMERIARVSLGELSKYLRAEFGVDRTYFKKVDELTEEYARKYSEPFPDAVLFVRDVIEASGRNMLYTHRDRLALELLERAGMAKYFSDAIVDGDPDFVWKPSPKAIRALIRRNGLERTQTIMVGDREIDVQSAAKAKIDSCLIMPYDISAESVATYKCKDFAAFREVLAQ